MEKVLTLGALAVAAYFVYEWFFVTPATAATTTTPATTATTSTTTSTAATTAAATTSLASLYSALVAKVTAANDPSVQNNGETLTATPDVFNYYLAEIMPTAPAGYTGSAWPPDPLVVFNGRPSMSITTYWSGMSAYLTSTAGMSGLGVFAGLGALASMGRRGMGKYEQLSNQYPGWPEVAGAWPGGGAGRPVQ